MRLAAPWKRCPECGYTHAATICHACKTPAPVFFTEADIELEAAPLLPAGGAVESAVVVAFSTPPFAPVA